MFEKVNPAHPDKIADRIAGAIVDLAYNENANPKIAVEVLIGHGMCKLRFPQLSRFCPVLPHERKSFRSPYPPSHPCILQGFFAVTASLFPARTDLSAHSQQRRPCMKVKGKIVYWTDH